MTESEWKWIEKTQQGEQQGLVMEINVDVLK
jgi:hypothetical protein